MTLRYSAQAERDLERIGDWISADNPIAAVTFVRALREKCRKVAEFPMAFPRVAGKPNLHRAGYRKYIIFYRVTKSGVTISSIRHGARRPLDG